MCKSAFPCASQRVGLSFPKQLLPLPVGLTIGGVLLLFLSSAISAEFKLEQVVNGTAAGEALSGVFRITDTGGQSLVGASRSGSGQWRIEHGFWPTIGSPPALPILRRSMQSGHTLILPFETLTAQADDPDQDVVRVSSVVPVSARGGKVEMVAAGLIYTPPSSFVGLDHFTYALVDDGGDVASGEVAVTVGAAQPEPPRVVFGPIVTNGVLQVRYEGVPGLTYTIETCERLGTGAWQKLINVTAPEAGGAFGAGVFEVRDMVNPASNRFFRAVWPAY